MRLVVVYIALGLVSALVSLPVRAQDVADEARRVHRLHRDALPQTTAYQIASDRRGWVWIATQSGIAYYNGRTWQKLDELSADVRDGFDRGRRILATEDGRLWFAPRYGGVYTLTVRPGLHARHWPVTHTTTRDGLPSDSVAALLTRRDGRLLAGTSEGVAAWRGGAWEPIDGPAGLESFSVVALIEARAGGLWASSRQGVWRQAADGAWTRESLPGPLAGRTVAALHEDRKGRLWAVAEGIIARRDADGWHLIAVDAQDPRPFASILELPNGTMWFGTFGPRHGVTILRPSGSWRRLGLDNGLPSEDILSLMVHPDGTCWIGTRNGIALYSGNEWSAITRASGLPGEYVWDIAEDARGAFWFGTDRGVSVYEAGTWRTLGDPEGGPFVDVRFIYHASDGETYLANRSTLYRYRDGQLRLIVKSDGLRFYSAFEYGGEQLFTTATGIFALRGDALEPYSTKWYFNRTVKATEVSRTGALWIAVNRHGVIRVTPDGQHDYYTPEHGLPAADVLGLYEDDLGLLWAATVEGVGVFDGRRWRTFTDTTTIRMPDPFTYNVLQDTQRRYYISTNRGVVRLTRTPGTAHVDSLHFAVEYFGPGDGLPSYEANFGAALRDSQGRIWFGTVAGAALFDPSAEVYSPGPAPVELERVDVANLPDSVLVAQVSTPGTLELDHPYRTLTFTYTHGAVSRPESIHYRTRLIGYDGMSAWTAEGQRTFTNLPPGDYVFRIWGRGPDGAVSGPADFPFSIAVAPWASWWAYFLYTLCGLLLVAAVVRWQTLRIQRVHAQEAAVLQERVSREAAEDQAAHLRDENRRLAAEQFRDDMIRMLVHDLRSPLSIMQMVCREVMSMPDMPRETVAELMGHVVGTSEQALRLVDLILDVSRLEAGQMPVNTERVVVAEAAGEALSTLWRLADEKGVSLEADLAPGLPALRADRRLLDRVLANLLGNAIKFTPVGGSVRLAAARNGDLVELRVTDTGVGIPHALHPHLFQKFVAGDEEGSGSGLGLAFCRLAVEAMKGRIIMAHTSSAGTTFLVRLPADLPPGLPPDDGGPAAESAHGDGETALHGSAISS